MNMELSEYHKEVARTFPSDGHHAGVEPFGIAILSDPFGRLARASHSVEFEKKRAFYGQRLSDAAVEALANRHVESGEVLDTYLKLAFRRCARDSDNETNRATLHALSGLGGEFHEVIIAWMEGNRTKLVAEIGDALFYLTAFCNVTDITLEEAMTANVAKLRARYPDGFSAEKAVNRDEAAEQGAMEVASAAG